MFVDLQNVHRIIASLAVAVAVFAATALSVAAAPGNSSPVSDEIGQWIDGLGDDSYANRQAAAGQLTAAGYAAREALADAARGPDPEIRAAARRILTLIDDNAFAQ